MYNIISTKQSTWTYRLQNRILVTPTPYRCVCVQTVFHKAAGVFSCHGDPVHTQKNSHTSLIGRGEISRTIAKCEIM